MVVVASREAVMDTLLAEAPNRLFCFQKLQHTFFTVWLMGTAARARLWLLSILA